MKLATTFALLSGSLLIGLSPVSFADDHDGSDIQTAIDQHNINIQRFETEHPGKALPKGLLHSRDILERIQAGERPDVARPDRPEMPDIAMRPELPEMAQRASRPETPNRPDKSNNGRH